MPTHIKVWKGEHFKRNLPWGKLLLLGQRLSDKKINIITQSINPTYFYCICSYVYSYGKHKLMLIIRLYNISSNAMLKVVTPSSCPSMMSGSKQLDSRSIPSHLLFLEPIHF